MDTIDLRSDTVTHPTEHMRQAMANAPVGDDVFDEDPTVNRLQEVAAARLGKDAGLFVPSGTMGNLAAVLAHCGRGDEAIMGNQGHTFLHEAGGMAALGGVHPLQLSNQPDGSLAFDEIASAIREDDVHHPISKLVILENTQNSCGGVPISVEYTDRVGQLAHSHGLKLHIDGARIFNAAIALGVPAARLAQAADSVTFCLSKGLCAPVGSVLCGTPEFIHQARRLRKQLGGGMRQAGILAAAGLIALDEMVDRLAEDHRRAAALADELARIPGVCLYLGRPATNMVYLSIDPEIGLTASDAAALLEKKGVRVMVAGRYRFRLVTHAWIDDQDIDVVVKAFQTLKNLRSSR
jgi:threonine aldolase